MPRNTNQKDPDRIFYSEYYFNKDDKDGLNFEKIGQDKERGWLNDMAFSTRFDVNEYWTIKFELHKMDGVALTFPDENMNEAGTATDYEADWYLFGAKVTFNF